MIFGECFKVIKHAESNDAGDFYDKIIFIWVMASQNRNDELGLSRTL